MYSRSILGSWYVIGLAGGLLLGVLIAAAPVPFAWVVAVVALVGLSVAATLKYPATMLVPVLFIPQWKTLAVLQPIQDRVDLTVAALIVLGLVLLMQLLRTAHTDGLRNPFSGEGLGIATFFLFVAVIAVSYIYTPAPNWGMTETTRLLFIGGLLLVSPFILIKTEEDFRQFCQVFLIFSMARAVQTMLFPEYGKGGRLEGLVKTDIGAAWLVGMAIIILLYYDVFQSSRARTLAKIICLPVLAAGVVAATARGPILALLLVVVCARIFKPRNPFRDSSILKSLGIAILVVLGVWVAMSSLWWTRGRLNEKTTELLGILEGSAPGTGSAVERLAFYKAAISEIGERPMAGLGVGGWAVYYTGKDERQYPHNLVLLIAVEQGLIGVTALLIFLAAVGFALRRIIRASGDAYFVLFALVLFSLTVSMFSGDLDTNRLLWFWCGMSFAFSRLVAISIARQTLTRQVIGQPFTSRIADPQTAHSGM
jgi:O-antigen ligase